MQHQALYIVNYVNDELRKELIIKYNLRLKSFSFYTLFLIFLFYIFIKPIKTIEPCIIMSPRVKLNAVSSITY